MRRHRIVYRGDRRLPGPLHVQRALYRRLRERDGAMRNRHVQPAVRQRERLRWNPSKVRRQRVLGELQWDDDVPLSRVRRVVRVHHLPTSERAIVRERLAVLERELPSARWRLLRSALHLPMRCVPRQQDRNGDGDVHFRHRRNRPGRRLRGFVDMQWERRMHTPTERIELLGGEPMPERVLPHARRGLLHGNVHWHLPILSRDRYGNDERNVWPRLDGSRPEQRMRRHGDVRWERRLHTHSQRRPVHVEHTMSERELPSEQPCLLRSTLRWALHVVPRPGHGQPDRDVRLHIERDRPLRRLLGPRDMRRHGSVHVNAARVR